MKRNSIIITVIVVLIAVLAVFGFTKKNTNQSDKTASSNIQSTKNATATDQSSPSDAPTGTAQNAQTTITYTDNGFSPSSITVKSGTTLTVTNSSSHVLQFDSDPHPEHTDNTELNVNIVSKAQSKTFTVTRTGTFGYHNHLNEDDRGTIVVE